MDNNIAYPNEWLPPALLPLENFSTYAGDVWHNQDLEDRELTFLKLVIGGRYRSPDGPSRVFLTPMPTPEQIRCERMYGDIIGYGGTMPINEDMQFRVRPANTMSSRIPAEHLKVKLDIEREVCTEIGIIENGHLALISLIFRITSHILMSPWRTSPICCLQRTKTKPSVHGSVFQRYIPWAELLQSHPSTSMTST